MRILHVPHGYGVDGGGAELLATRVSEGLAAMGHDVDVLVPDVETGASYARLGAPPVGPAAETRAGVRVERLPYRAAAGWRGWAVETWPLPLRGVWRKKLRRALVRRMAETLAERIRADRPDVVLTMAHTFANVKAVFAARQATPFALVYSPQLHPHQRGFQHDVVRRGAALADVVAANTTSEADRLRRDYGARAGDVVVTGCGADAGPTPTAAPRSPTVLFLGRKTATKGLDDLVAAMQRVWETHPDARLVLAGRREAGDGALDRLLAALPADAARRVVSEDDVDEARKATLLGEAALLVLPSRHESFGIVLLEAWARGTPVVTFDLPVFRDIVTHGENGVLVEGGSAGGLADAITGLLDRPEDTRRLGRRGYDTLLENHTWERVVTRWEDALRQAVGRAG